MGWCGKISVVVLALLAGVAYNQYRKLTAPSQLVAFDVQAYWGPGSGDQHKDSTAIKPFSVSYAKVGDAAGPIEELVAVLKRPLVLPPSLEGVGFEYGVNSVALQEIVRYWRDDYLSRWPAREAFLNRFAHFTTQIQGLNIHYIHVKPTAKQAAGKRVVPLLLLHGWPGSVREFYEIIPKLTNADALKGDIVFEVVLPSLPGYGWSQASAKTGFGPAEMSIVLRNLMIRLGHSRFVIQGGDWGSLLGSNIATIFPQNVLGYHSNMCFTNSPLSNLKAIIASFSPTLFVDKQHVDFFFPRLEKYVFLIMETGYFHIQATKPDTIGTALSHSPIGLLAYIVEKFSSWTNKDYRQLPQGGWEEFSADFKDAILDNIMIYHLSNSITTSQRLYAEAFTFQQMGYKLDTVQTTVPTGCARFMHDLAHSMDYQLRDKYVNLVHSTYYPDGGHFAAMEKAQWLYEDLVQFAHKAL